MKGLPGGWEIRPVSWLFASGFSKKEEVASNTELKAKNFARKSLSV